MKYLEFVSQCALPLSPVIRYYGDKYHTPVYGQVIIFTMLIPIHVLLLIPGVLFGVVFGIPYVIYNNIRNRVQEQHGDS